MIVSSNQSYQDLSNIFPFAKKKTFIVKFSCPTALKTQINRHVIKEFQTGKRFIYIPNQFWEHKNHLNLIKAVKIASQNNKHLKVVCSGGTSDFKWNHNFHYLKCLNTIKRLKINKNIKILGEVTYQNVISLMKYSHAVCNPSLFEGWSTPVEEAKILNKMLCISNIPVHREQAPNAIFFDPNSPQSIAQALCKTWRQKSKQKCAYTIHNLFDQFQKVII